jgi:hypothetical protein
MILFDINFDLRFWIFAISELINIHFQCNGMIIFSLCDAWEHILVFEFMNKHSASWRVTENRFIGVENSFSSISLENIKENGYILMEYYPDCKTAFMSHEDCGRRFWNFVYNVSSLYNTLIKTKFQIKTVLLKIVSVMAIIISGMKARGRNHFQVF